jgi:hypothetical protein
MTAAGQELHFGKISAQRRLARPASMRSIDHGGRLPASRSRWRIVNVDVAAEVGQTVFSTSATCNGQPLACIVSQAHEQRHQLAVSAQSRGPLVSYDRSSKPTEAKPW